MGEAVRRGNAQNAVVLNWPVSAEDNQKAGSQAIKIQSIFRGYRTRQAAKAPQGKVTNYILGSVTNEIEFQPEPKLNSVSGNFTLLGCGSLKNLEIINGIISWEQYKEIQPTILGYTNIPKLFIVDNSRPLLKSWQLLRKIFIESESIEDVQLSCALVYGRQFRAVSRNWDLLMIEYNEYFSKLELNDPMKFFVFKSILEKATFILGDWSDKKVFEYLKPRINNNPLYIYASNIIEYVNYIVYPASSNEVLESIDHLSPDWSIHMRTDVDAMRFNFMSPSYQLVLSKEQSSTEQYQTLCNSSYLPLKTSKR